MVTIQHLSKSRFIEVFVLGIKSVLKIFPFKQQLKFLVATLVLFITLFMATAHAGENDSLFSIHPNDENVLIIDGNFKAGAYREYRRFLRVNNDVDIIILNSLGGLINEALDIAQHIHDTGVSVSVPAGNKCYSACSFLVFASPKKEIEGEIGLHKFYFQENAVTSSVNELSSNVQATVGEILDLFMAWGVPSFVLPKMLLNDEIYLLTEEEKSLLKKVVPVARIEKHDLSNQSSDQTISFEDKFNKKLKFSQEVCISTRTSTAVEDIAGSLRIHGVIDDELAFVEVFSEFVDLTKIKRGNFYIPPNSSMSEIAKTITQDTGVMCGNEIVFRAGITKPKVMVRKLNPRTLRFSTIDEFIIGEDEPANFSKMVSDPTTSLRIGFAAGISSWRAISAVHSLRFLKGDVPLFQLELEGSLAPNSYRFEYNDTKNKILEEMSLRQISILDQAWQSRDKDLPLSNKNELLILASIIEKETGKAEEYKLISSVFVNRLINDMHLQSDPTVIYGITRGVHALGRGLRQSELKSDTPWNTFTRKGLPKTPICNPSEEAINAASRPAKTDYLFFVSDGAGGHNFAASLREHNKNVEKWRALQK